MNESDNILHVYSAPGLGDALWNLQKLYLNTDRNIHLHTFQRNEYSSPFLKGLKRVVEVDQFKEPYNNYNEFLNKCHSDYNTMQNITPGELNSLSSIYMEANKWLESGIHLKNYYPNLDTTYEMDWEISKEEENKAKNVIDTFDTIVLYTSSIASNSFSALRPHWSFEYWLTIIQELIDTFDNLKIVWIGASYDINIKEHIQNKYPNENIEYFIDEAPGFILSLLKQSKCFISYQSGLSCISIVEKIPTYMVYYDFLTKLPNQICHPDCVNNEYLYKPIYFKELGENLKSPSIWAKQHMF